jgi:hypothetical protein
MKQLQLKHLAVASAVLSIVIFAGVSVSIAGEMTKVSGKIIASYTDEKKVEVGDVEGHVISFSTSQGTNASAGKNVFLDGAAVTNYSMGDLVKGNGVQHGYIQIMKGDDGTICKWEHKVNTTFPKEGVPSITFSGTFTYTKGMGKFAGIKGGGTFKGSFVSEKEYAVEWEGEYSLEK